jgi:cytoskeletal protein RodZ
MKRCPECYEAYDDEQRYCENDGKELLADPAYSPKPEVVVVNSAPARNTWWLAAALGVLIGVVFGAGVFVVALLISREEKTEQAPVSQATDAREKLVPNRVVAPSNTAPTPEPEASPSPDSEEEAEAEPSPATNTETKTASVQLNQGPISTGQKTRAGEGESAGQTVIEMTDGSTLDVDAAWEDKQGIWYRRSGLVSFVDSSRVKAITSRRDAKMAEAPHR